MEELLTSAMELARLLSPERISSLADRMRTAEPLRGHGQLQHFVRTPVAREALDRLLAAWAQTGMSGDVVAGVLHGAAFARQETLRESNTELVWTGPTTPFIATRRTHQVLLDMIERAEHEIFLVSFVAYDVPALVNALNEASDRQVGIKALLETAQSKGGSLTTDPIETLRACVPATELYVWTNRQSDFEAGKVHAKIVVVDRKVAFLTSANLTEHAFEKNMEAGVLITDGSLPFQLHSHLQALIDTRVITKRP